jgi:hypothetical protein
MAKARARPTYSEAVAEMICARLAEGQGLRGACAGQDMPSPATVMGWIIDNYQGFGERYARAKEIAVAILSEELVEISDDGAKDVKVDADGRESIDHDAINRARLRVDTRKWLLSKLIPKKYGERLDVKHTATVTLLDVLGGNGSSSEEA